jgi:hypothetical protein
VTEFLDEFENPEDAQDDQHFRRYSRKRDTIIGHKSNCMMMFYNLTRREQRDPNGAAAKEEMDTASERFMELVNQWRKRRAAHDAQPQFIDLTNLPNSNSNSSSSESGSSRSSRSRSRSTRRSRSRQPNN